VSTPVHPYRCRPRPGESVGRWVVQEVLGDGGTSWVVRARQAGVPARTCALKILKDPRDAESRARLARERRVLQDVQHEHLIRSLGEGAPDWTALERVDGPTLPTTRLPPSRAADLMRAIAGAVAALHAAGVSHGDLKPDNILLGPDGPVLIDLGHSEPTGQVAIGSDPEGSLAWAPPEKLLARELDPQRADVYGLGCLLYTLLTGTEPPGPAVDALPLDPGPGAPTRLRQAVRRATCADPQGRPADGWEFLALLEREVAPARRSITLPLAALAALLLGSLLPGLLLHRPGVHDLELPRPPAPRPRASASIDAPHVPPWDPGSTSTRTPSSGWIAQPHDRPVHPHTACEGTRLLADPSGGVRVTGLQIAGAPVQAVELPGCVPDGAPVTLVGHALDLDQDEPIGSFTAQGTPLRLICSSVLRHCRAEPLRETS